MLLKENEIPCCINFHFISKSIIQLIVSGHLGNHGMLVLSHAEVELEREFEQNRSPKLMVVHAQEHYPIQKPAILRNVQV